MNNLKTVIATSFDENLFKQTTVLLKTFYENYKDENAIDFYCLVPPELMIRESEFINYLGEMGNINVKFIYSEKWVDLVKDKTLKGSLYITENAWHRIFLSSLFPDYNRAIYIDSDAMIVGDISELINYDVDAEMIAKFEISNVPFEIFNTQDRLYFNDGVFITNLDYWRENNLEQQMIDYVLENGSTLYIEQDLLNIFFEDKVAPLPQTFNFGPWQNEVWTIKNLNVSPVIVHWFGKEKPWSGSTHKEDKWKDSWIEKYKSLTKTDIEDLAKEKEILDEKKKEELEKQKRKTCYVTSLDENYFSYASVVVKTFCDNYHGEETLDYFVLVEKSMMNRESEFLTLIGDTGKVVVKFASSDRYDDFCKEIKESDKDFHVGGKWINDTVFHRVFLSSLFPEYGRGVYMDADMIILRDVQPIVDYPMVNKMMAKIEHGMAPQIAFGEKDWSYFNAGFFITDLNYWRENDIENKILNFARDVDSLNWAEQDILNVIFRHNFHALPETFNLMDWQVKNHPDFTAAYSDPLIVHFAGSVKPWHIHGNRSKYDILWRAKYKEVSGLDLDLIQELKEEDFLPPEHEPIMFENDISRKLFGNLPSSSLPPSE